MEKDESTLPRAMKPIRPTMKPIMIPKQIFEARIDGDSGFWFLRIAVQWRGQTIGVLALSSRQCLIDRGLAKIFLAVIP